MASKPKKIPVKGDYVLGSKYEDGYPCDPFYVGFFLEMMDDRYMITDADGTIVRASGYRRCERISQRAGKIFCKLIPHISDRSGKSVWWWIRHIKAMQEVLDVLEKKNERN